jgi:hypothetical protein
VIAVGDYNFDWDASFGDSSHDAGYDLMTAGGIFRWVRPGELVRTQCGFNSVLDFVFVGGSARLWIGDSEIVFRQDNSHCPDNASRSDHRPVTGSFTLPPSDGVSAAAKAAIIERLNEKELQEIKMVIGAN